MLTGIAIGVAATLAALVGYVLVHAWATRHTRKVSQQLDWQIDANRRQAAALERIADVLEGMEATAQAVKPDTAGDSDHG